MDDKQRGAGLLVKCPNCGRICFVTTDEYDPDKVPHGGMVKLLHECSSWGIEWLTHRVTLAPAMTCPKCEAPLVLKERLVIVSKQETKEAKETKEPAKPVMKKTREQGVFVCPECGKSCKSKAGLLGHMRSHKK